MPKSIMDWMAVVALWLGAAVMAIKAGDLPLIAGAPGFLASPLWGVVPFALVTLSGLIFLYRALALTRGMAPPSVALLNPQTPSTGEATPARLSVLPGTTVGTIYNLVADHMATHAAPMLKPYLGKWMTITAKVENVKPYATYLTVFPRHVVDGGKSHDGFVKFSFDLKWADHVGMLQKNQDITVCGQIRSISISGLFLGHCEFAA